MSLLRNSVKAKFDKSIGLLLLRLSSGGLMITHGYGKFMNVITGDLSFADPIGLGPEISLILAAFSEFICAILIMFGLYTRLATVPLILTMLVAAFIQHGDDPLAQKEKALLFATGYLVLFFTGAGRYSVDHNLYKHE